MKNISDKNQFTEVVALVKYVKISLFTHRIYNIIVSNRLFFHVLIIDSNLFETFLYVIIIIYSI